MAEQGLMVRVIALHGAPPVCNGLCHRRYGRRRRADAGASPRADPIRPLTTSPPKPLLRRPL
jgi:hypothetical protein